ncbi:PREDICTED: stromal cell-derived factor 2-like protein 1 [Pterocles gutturalis]|uniref:stromal cell-derived factor 2-like protein 1 n=1 Tax=Pterocles gutturalis TaxID=240206 RepID=UPI000528E351|nr:PREDICTED: stromal cell-derived factor 2-like protein 1 [Pterocles gutturalis]
MGLWGALEAWRPGRERRMLRPGVQEDVTAVLHRSWSGDVTGMLFPHSRGSGQQSVTGVEASDDANSYWRIRGKSDGSCQRGTPVKCGQAIRLTHVNTGKNLHTHHFPSPLSNNQEVSAFGDDGEGDDLDIWIVQCSGTYWEREDAVRFKHVGTEVFLSITGEQYGHPIRGQREVHGMPTANHHNYWKAMEGVFVKPSVDPAKHDEL